MNKTLDLIDDTDRLLAEADENLKALEAMKVYDMLANVQVLVAKYEAFSKTLHLKKLSLLETLIQLALAIGKSSSAGYRCGSSSRVVCRLGDNYGSPLEQFCHDSHYRAFCKEILVGLEEYLRTTPETQKAERQALESLMSEFRDLFKGKGKGK
ncbi:MAG: hypothetical protein WCW31_04105 [Patescibacteria group bacterium]